MDNSKMCIEIPLIGKSLPYKTEGVMLVSLTK